MTFCIRRNARSCFITRYTRGARSGLLFLTRWHRCQKRYRRPPPSRVTSVCYRVVRAIRFVTNKPDPPSYPRPICRILSSGLGRRLISLGLVRRLVPTRCTTRRDAWQDKPHAVPWIFCSVIDSIIPGTNRLTHRINDHVWKGVICAQAPYGFARKRLKVSAWRARASNIALLYQDYRANDRPRSSHLFMIAFCSRSCPCN